MNLEHILWEICVKGPKRVFNGGHVIKSGTYALQIAEFDQMRNPQNAEKCDKTNILCIRLGFFCTHSDYFATSFFRYETLSGST